MNNDVNPTWFEDSEELIGKGIAHVVFRKKYGCLFATNKRVVFQVDNSQPDEIFLKFANKQIKDTEVNDPDKSQGKVFLKITTFNEQGGFVFQFIADSSALDTIAITEIRDTFAKTLAKLIKDRTDTPPGSPQIHSNGESNGKVQNGQQNYNSNAMETKKEEVPPVINLSEAHITSSVPSYEKRTEQTTTYVAFKVVIEMKDKAPIICWRRYSDFEQLKKHLSKKFPKTDIPPLPEKALLSRFNEDFLQERREKLEKFIQYISQQEILLEDEQLVNFLTSQSYRYSFGEFSTGYTDVLSYFKTVQDQIVDFTPLVALENSMKGAGKSFSLEEDYATIKKMMDNYKLVEKKYPFEKFVVSCLGTTSAGKSGFFFLTAFHFSNQAFVNHFYRLVCKKSAIGQMDTHFTLIETVSKEDFMKLSDKFVEGQKYHHKDFSNEELLEQITTDVFSDPRYGYVFVQLDTTNTLARYDAQFRKYAKEISSYGLVRSILINEEYLGDDADSDLAKRTLMVDSPGFDLAPEREILEQFLGNLKILQFFYNMSDITLFFIPAAQISMVSGQISMLELSILYAIHGAGYINQLMEDVFSSNKNQNWIPSINDVKSMIVKKFTQTHSPKENFSYKGTAVWDGIKFIMSKIDEVYKDEDKTPDMNEQFYELGRSFGKHLGYLEPPTYSQCLTIALPEQQKKGKRIVTGQLQVLKESISTLNSESTYANRIDEAIQEMCLTLESTIKLSWSSYYSNDLNIILEIQKRSHNRLKKQNR